ncbi:g11143 [Coccomyxa viridis]|uniref:G11143 protein n=1 Tax=Coccomyxa viridis TaxID=1274662 RepID=A0ABP1G9Y1_9CHLO
MNQYHLFEVLGHGKDSTVYKGRKKQTICYCAIKRVPKTAKARVLQEVRAMTALQHNNVLRFHSWCETRNHLWLVLEYCVGGDLLTLLKEEPVLSEDSVRGFGQDLALALQHAHANGLVYCDLKPSSILLDEKGSLKLGGFGLSQKIATVQPLTLQQAKRASPAYMAPELFQSGPQSTASDLWALGCILYECAAGQPPFSASSPTQLVQDIMAADPAPVADVSAAFEDLITRLLDKNPATRIGWEDACLGW